MAYAMEMPKLLNDLEHHILDHILTENNAPKFYLEGIRFENKALIDRCEELITEHFDTLSSNATDSTPTFLKDLPYERLKSVLSNDGLKVTQEKFVLSLIERYLKHRETLPPLPEEDPKNDWSLLNEDEKAKRTEDKKVADDEAKAAEDARNAEKKAAYDALDDLGKIQSRATDRNTAAIEKCNSRLELRRLNRKQRADLL